MRRWLAGAVLVALGGCGGHRSAKPAVLVRCAPARPEPCATVRVALAPAEASRLLGSTPSEVATGWRIDVSGARLTGRGTPLRTDVAGRVMVLVDVSGSMRGPKIGAARLVLRQFLATLDSVSSGTVKVAVAPFGSVEVASRIGAAQFEAPSEAAATVGRLPSPTVENTALYSAVVLASHRLRDEVRRQGERGLGVLVVITDGNNEVRPGDDAGLLRGEAGLAEAASAVTESGAATGILGIGNLDYDALARLAGPAGEVFPVSATAGPFDLADPLGRIATALRTTWQVAFHFPDRSRLDLARGWQPVAIGLELDGEDRPIGQAEWRPPLAAPPLFAGATDFAPSSGKRPWLGSLLIAVLLLVVLLEVWVVIPRLLWRSTGTAAPSGAAAPAPVGFEPAGPRAAPARRADRSQPIGPEIRADVTEAAPRKLNEVTGSWPRPTDG